MRLLTFRNGHGVTRAGRVVDDDVVELDFPDVGSLLAAGDWNRLADVDGKRLPLDGLDLAPVVTAPRKIICLGLNYRAHILEMGRDLPQHPTLFAKYARALIGANDDIVLPQSDDEMDWEAELAFVIGREVRHADRDEAVDAIAGYTVLNDVSARQYQWRTTQWLQGKTFEHTSPVGPWLVTADEFGGDLSQTPDLEIRCEVDGELRQRACTGELLFGPVDLVVYISDIVTLEPGDIVATGTPGGVGAGRDPRMFLEPGQVVRTVVEGIGELKNTCVEDKREA